MRREAKGQADAIFMKLDAEARGNFEILKAKGDGFQQIVSACGNNADAAAKMLIIEKLEQLVQMQAEAIKGIKIDKVTVWDGGKSADGKTATSNFLSGMVKSLPPLHDIANMAGTGSSGLSWQSQREADGRGSGIGAESSQTAAAEAPAAK